MFISDNSNKTSKIEHVIHSAFSSTPIIFKQENEMNFNYQEFYDANIRQLNAEYRKNADLCRHTLMTICKE
jgi:hypothetical protein